VVRGEGRHAAGNLARGVLSRFKGRDCLIGCFVRPYLQMETAPDDSKIRSLHGLRGVMAWWVVVGHLALAFGLKLPLIDRPALAVDVFILLSGFVIAMLVERKAEAYLPYILRRAFRLFPLYLPLLLISAMLLKLQLSVWSSLPPVPGSLDRIVIARAAFLHLPFHLGIHVAMLQGLVPSRFSENVATSIMAQAWSVSLEWQFYLIAPFLVGALYRKAWTRAGAMVILLQLLARYFSSAFLGAKILLFVAGIATRMAMEPRRRREALMLAAMCGAMTVFRDGLLELVPLLLWAAVMVSSRAPSDSVWQVPARLLSSRPAHHMGEISYSIYLVHFIPFFLATYACTRLGIGGQARMEVVAAAMIGLTYLGALGCYHLIERPGIRFGARLAHKFAAG